MLPVVSQLTQWAVIQKLSMNIVYPVLTSVSCRMQRCHCICVFLFFLNLKGFRIWIVGCTNYLSRIMRLHHLIVSSNLVLHDAKVSYNGRTQKNAFMLLFKCMWLLCLPQAENTSIIILDVDGTLDIAEPPGTIAISFCVLTLRKACYWCSEQGFSTVVLISPLQLFLQHWPEFSPTLEFPLPADCL